MDSIDAWSAREGEFTSSFACASGYDRASTGTAGQASSGTHARNLPQFILTPPPSTDTPGQHPDCLKQPGCFECGGHTLPKLAASTTECEVTPNEQRQTAARRSRLRIISRPYRSDPAVPASLTKLRSIASRLGGAVEAFVYPPLCARCGSSQGQTSECRLCGSCRELLACRLKNVCERCGAPVGPHLPTRTGCRHCRHDSFAFERVWALGVYEGELQRACVRTKQPFEEALTAGLAELLLDAWEGPIRFEEPNLIVPVPHYWMDRLAHRQHAPVTMGRMLSRRLKVPFSAHILSKVRRTPAQSSLPPAQRRQNLRRAFRLCRGVRLSGARVLLVDDILTTGTTADQAARVLCQGGAGTVLVAVLARGVGQGSDSRGAHA